MVDFGNLQEYELLPRIHEGDERAFALVYELYFDVLFVHGMSMLKDEEQVRDVIQEVFVQFWSKRSTLDITVSLSAYLYASTRYGVLKAIRRTKTYEQYLNHLKSVTVDMPAATDDQVREFELAQAIERHITALPAKMREVFELSRMQGLSYREIAELLGISEHTVKRQVSNALSILRKKLSDWQFLLI